MVALQQESRTFELSDFVVKVRYSWIRDGRFVTRPLSVSCASTRCICGCFFHLLCLCCICCITIYATQPLSASQKSIKSSICWLEKHRGKLTSLWRQETTAFRNSSFSRLRAIDCKFQISNAWLFTACDWLNFKPPQAENVARPAHITWAKIKAVYLHPYRGSRIFSFHRFRKRWRSVTRSKKRIVPCNLSSFNRSTRLFW